MVTRLVAVGDSVMWGQGNREANKFASQVAKARKLGKPDIVAHSGACIAKTSRTTVAWQEVPLDAPAILDQIDTAVRRLGGVSAVSLVLLNGGINDIPVSLVISGKTATLNTRIEKVFGEGGLFPALLKKAVQEFSAATIVALGYYPIISDKSSREARAKALLHLGPKGVARKMASLIERTGATELVAAAGFEAELKKMPALSLHFATRANCLMAAEVAKYPGRAYFAAPEWAPKHSLGGLVPWLWLGVNDPLFLKRLGAYLAHVAHAKGDWPAITPLASMGHPNLKGTSAYVTAVLKALPPLPPVR